MEERKSFKFVIYEILNFSSSNYNNNNNNNNNKILIASVINFLLFKSLIYVALYLVYMGTNPKLKA